MKGLGRPKSQPQNNKQGLQWSSCFSGQFDDDTFSGQVTKIRRLLYDYSTASGLLYKNWVTDQEKAGAPRSRPSAEDAGKGNSVILFKSIIVSSLHSQWLGTWFITILISKFLGSGNRIYQSCRCNSALQQLALVSCLLDGGWLVCSGLSWAWLQHCKLDPDMFPQLCEFGFWHLQPKSSNEYRKAQTQVESKKRKQQGWKQRGEGRRLSYTPQTPTCTCFGRNAHSVLSFLVVDPKGTLTSVTQCIMSMS